MSFVLTDCLERCVVQVRYSVWYFKMNEFRENEVNESETKIPKLSRNRDGAVVIVETETRKIGREAGGPTSQTRKHVLSFQKLHYSRTGTYKEVTSLSSELGMVSSQTSPKSWRLKRSDWLRSSNIRTASWDYWVSVLCSSDPSDPTSFLSD